MEEDTSNPPEVADTEREEEDDHGMDGEREAMGPKPALVQVQVQARRDVGDELVGAVVEGNVQAVEVGSDHIRQIDSSQMEGVHSFHMDSGEVGVRTWQVDQIVGCDNGVKGVAAAAAQCARTNNYHDGRTEYGQGVVVSGKLG